MPTKMHILTQILRKKRKSHKTSRKFHCGSYPHLEDAKLRNIPLICPFVRIFLRFLTLHILKRQSDIHNNIHFTSCSKSFMICKKLFHSTMWHGVLPKHSWYSTHTNTHISGTRCRAPDLPQERGKNFWGGLGEPERNRGTVATAENAAKRMKPNRQLPMAYKLNLLMYYRYLPTTTTTNTASDDDACCFFFKFEQKPRAERKRSARKKTQTNKTVKNLFKLLLSSFEIRRSVSASTSTNTDAWKRFALSL